MRNINLFKGEDWCKDALADKNKYYKDALTYTNQNSSTIKISKDPFHLLNGNIADFNYAGLYKIINKSKDMSLSDIVEILELNGCVDLNLFLRYNKIINEKNEYDKIEREIKELKLNRDKESKILIDTMEFLLKIYAHDTYNLYAVYSLKDFNLNKEFYETLSKLLNKDNINNQFCHLTNKKFLNSKTIFLYNDRFLILDDINNPSIHYLTSQFNSFDEDLLLEELTLILNIYPIINNLKILSQNREMFLKLIFSLRNYEGCKEGPISLQVQRNVDSRTSYTWFKNFIDSLEKNYCTKE